MNFFKSILSDDPDPSKPENPHESDSDSSTDSHRGDRHSNDVDRDDTAGVWSFGGLIKTIATRSESVIETYRRDLEEFGSGLKKETEIIREVASRAVKDLPTSIEAGASAAQGAFDGVLKSTADIISKEALIFASDGEPETPEASRSLNSARYSWFDSQLSAMQSDLNTYCEEPEDVDEYKKWKLGIELEGKRNEIEALVGENGLLEGVYEKIVPSVVDHETFWCRYFYRLDKLEQQERVRGNLVKRAISVDDEEELSWDVDDEDEDGDVKVVGNVNEQSSGVKVKGGDGVEGKVVSDESLDPVQKQEGSNNSSSQDDMKEGGNLNVDDSVDNNVVKEPTKDSSEDVSSGKEDAKSKEVAEVKKIDEEVKAKDNVKEKNDEKVGEEEKGGSGTKTDASVELSNQSKVEEEEEDLGWDEIEDIGSGDEKKNSATTSSGNPNRADLKKRLSVEEDDEDLSWDIEDDDEPVKS
ncbi:hypothetical protein ACJIZ3_016706 [Penstemon smallii]|uniref:BSD domain-containing protein n=1 Tax=Penstemon smallii TaxID=265156 RepID=A0ABD3STH5_9LAMI